ncbi:MAG: hypothetical protein U9Q69_01430 [Nanoarchaeota archaeon]|nr:hypothetical protein [Nanoarchaeota archaeon]
MADKENEKRVDWREVFSWKKALIIITSLILISFFAYHFGYIKKTCTTNECFEDAMKSCSPAKYLKLQNLNYYTYSIKGRRGDFCLIHIELKKMAEGTSLEKKIMFEGKDMKCKVPLRALKDISSSQVEGMLNYCSGPLKESMYELIIKKLYTLIISNMGDIIGEIQSTIAGEI